MYYIVLFTHALFNGHQFRKSSNIITQKVNHIHNQTEKELKILPETIIANIL